MRQSNINLAHEIFKTRKSIVSKAYLLERLGCSNSSLKRVFITLRSDYGAPLFYNKELNGYYYTDQNFELNLPSVWGSTETLLAIVSLQKLLEQMCLDILDEPLRSLKDEISKHLKLKKIQAGQINRIRILPINARITKKQHFQVISSAVLQRYSLKISYHARGSDESTNRTISPQRLAHYKDNWYLDAWCHLRNELRTFSLERITFVENSYEKCIDIADQILDQHLTSGYGIFSGLAKQNATLRFAAQRAQWIVDEIWHPDQKGAWMTDGRYQLEIPYADDRELIMDIMRHIPYVEIVSPPELKEAVISYLQQSLAQHIK